MIDNQKDLLHIQSVLEANGYELVENTDQLHWFVMFEYSFDGFRIHRAIFRCPDGAAALRAVRSLLRGTAAYDVQVCSPIIRTVVSYYGTKNLLRDWRRYYGAAGFSRSEEARHA